MKPTLFKHSGHLGDILCSLPVIREYCRQRNKKATLLLAKGVIAAFPEGTIHPTKNENGDMILLNQEVIDMLIPLIKAQPYIDDCKVLGDETVDIDLDNMREMFVNMPYSCLSRVYFYAYPDMACDLSEKWLTVPETDKDFAKGKIIISRTERYTNPVIDYSFLKQFEDDILFAGTMREYNNFCMNFDLNVRKLNVSNFLELSQAINQSKFHLSNQTMAYQLSQGTKHPRILETCNYAPNIIPIGKDAFDFYTQFQLEYYFYRLNGMEKQFKDAYIKEAKESPNAKYIGDPLELN
jgi:hypothetical protein